MTKKEFETLLTDYGNATFDCGEYNDDDVYDRRGCTEYKDLNARAAHLKQKIIDCLFGKENK